MSQEIHYAERQQNTVTTTAEALWRIRERETAVGFENEKKFMEHILKLQKIGYGLTQIELRKKTAFKFVHRNGIRTTSNTEKGMARNDWATGFLSRYPELSTRKAEAISYGRAMCLKQSQVDVFFNAYELLVQQLDLTNKP